MGIKPSAVVLFAIVALVGCDDEPDTVPVDAAAADASDATDGPDTECDCDDGDPCTFDRCLVNGLCNFEPLWTQECMPQVAISAPVDGSWLTGIGQEVPVTATVTGDAPLEVLVDGEPHDAAEFPATTARHGINMVAVSATDAGKRRSTAVSSFMAAQAYYPTTAGPDEAAVTPSGLLAWLGPEAWDDDDPSDRDDVATLLIETIEGLDIPALLAAQPPPEDPNPIVDCILVESVTFDLTTLDLTPGDGVIALSAVLENTAIGFSTKVDQGCIEVAGTLHVVTATASGDLALTIDDDGAVTAAIPVAEIDLQDVTVDSEGTTGALVALLVALFEGQLENALEDAVKTQVAQAVTDALVNFSSSTLEVDIPPLPGRDVGLTVAIGVRPAALEITPTGVALTVGAQVTAPKAAGLPSDALGTPMRSQCGGEPDAPPTLPTDEPLAIALHDDLLNQLLFAAWWGGMLHGELGAEAFAGLTAGQPVTIDALRLDPRLPPVLTACTDSGGLHCRSARSTSRST